MITRDISVLLGKTLKSITGQPEGDEMIFITDQGERYKMHHFQDCCESVYINDICGDLEDLIGSPIIRAEERSSEDWPNDVEKPEYDPESCTWTFYELATIKGSVTIRWLGESNGYYSESVDISEIESVMEEG